MNTLPVIQSLTMSSREIAELIGKQHSHVLRDIDNVLATLNPELALGFKSTSYVDSTGKTNRMYEMDRDSTYCLVAGYDVNARMRIIKRWQELEASPLLSIPQTPATLAVADLQAFLTVSNLFNCPAHLAQIEAVKFANNRHGVDFSQALLSAPAQNNVQESDVMLEPTELCQMLGLASATPARYVNALLAIQGLQTKINGEWVPTPVGKQYCTRHAWKKGNKSGYNLKWNLAKVRKLLNS